jgi:hypothetical protein
MEETERLARLMRLRAWLSGNDDAASDEDVAWLSLHPEHLTIRPLTETDWPKMPGAPLCAEYVDDGRTRRCGRCGNYSLAHNDGQER